jgi:hypothetical protein
MMVIFSDLIDKVMEVFMDDFSIFGKTFEGCLAILDKVLKRCQMANLVVNWEKCHFMVREGIVLGHKISEKGIKVDKVKIEVIEELPPPTNVKEIHSFLGPFIFTKECLQSFHTVTPTFYKNKNFVQIGVHIKMHIKLWFI